MPPAISQFKRTLRVAGSGSGPRMCVPARSLALSRLFAVGEDENLRFYIFQCGLPQLRMIRPPINRANAAFRGVSCVAVVHARAVW